MPSILLALVLAITAQSPSPFRITVNDEQTGRGVPLIELETVNNIKYVTDSQGIVAFDEPGLMNQTVYFAVKGHGYESPKDGFGFRGHALQVAPGGNAQLSIRRVNVAERLYRVTGAGICRDSVLTGVKTPLPDPVLNGRVLGSDSVVNAVYHGKVYWFWGDTNRPGYPLGNFQVPGATSRLPADGGLDPEVGVALDYWLDKDGFAKETARMPGDGPTWISGPVVLRDPSGRERMFAHYVKVRNLLDVYESGLAEWDDASNRFQKVVAFPNATLHSFAPGGHPFQDGEYVVFANPYPLLRVRAEPDRLKDVTQYEALSCLETGSRLEEGRLDRDASGALRYQWRRNTPVVGPGEEAKLIKAGKMKREESPLQLRDADTGKLVSAHAGSFSWNEYRKRWVLIFCESFGTSFLGETWYAESDTPVGPWVYARKIVTHEKYSFYNPKQHPMFDKEGGRVLFFEGTYTRTFSGNEVATPRYDYNQIMYKLDLADPRLNLPVALYPHSSGVPFATRPQRPPRANARPAFFALDRPGAGTRPVFADGGRGVRLGRRDEAEGRSPLFHALPPDATNPPATTVPLFEFTPEDGKDRVYSTAGTTDQSGYRLSPAPLCLVWSNPVRAVVVVEGPK